MIYKFVNWEVDLTEEKAHATRLGRIHDLLEKEQPLADEDEKYLRSTLVNGDHRDGKVKLGGWCFDFSDFLVRIWFEYELPCEEEDGDIFYSDKTLTQGLFRDADHLGEWIAHNGYSLCDYHEW